MENKVFRSFVQNIIHDLKKSLKKEIYSEEYIPAYISGLKMGYYSIFSILKHQAFVFCIDQNELGLADLKPDVDILGLDRSLNVEFEEDNWNIETYDENKAELYLYDSIKLLKDEAKEVLKKLKESSKDYDYNEGVFRAYVCLFFILKNLASQLEIDIAKINLEDIDFLE